MFMLYIPFILVIEYAYIQKTLLVCVYVCMIACMHGCTWMYVDLNMYIFIGEFAFRRTFISAKPVM